MYSCPLTSHTRLPRPRARTTSSDEVAEGAPGQVPAGLRHQLHLVSAPRPRFHAASSVMARPAGTGSSPASWAIAAGRVNRC